MSFYDSAPPCPICNKPVDLTRDRFADENGHVVHEGCYLNRVRAAQNDPPDPHHAE